MDDRSVNRVTVIVVIAVAVAWLGVVVSEAPGPDLAPMSPLVDQAPTSLTAPEPLEGSTDRPGVSAGRTIGDEESSETEENSATDLLGNDVMRAVAKYKVDETGSLYELHSPHTEIPRLGIPKS